MLNPYLEKLTQEIKYHQTFSKAIPVPSIETGYEILDKLYNRQEITNVLISVFVDGSVMIAFRYDDCSHVIDCLPDGSLDYMLNGITVNLTTLGEFLYHLEAQTLDSKILFGL
jgi:hypothetical protein